MVECITIQVSFEIRQAFETPYQMPMLQSRAVVLQYFVTQSETPFDFGSPPQLNMFTRLFNQGRLMWRLWASRNEHQF